MKKKLLLHIALLIAVNLLIKPLWIFGIDLKVQNTVGAANYGIFFAIFNFSFLFHMLLDLGINQFNNRSIAQEPTKLAQQVGQLFMLKGFLAILYFVVTFGIAFLIDFDGLQFKYLFWLAINQLLLTFVLFSRSNFTALEWYGWDTFFSVFDRLLSLILCAGMLYIPVFLEDFTLETFIYLQTFALLIAAIFSLSVLFYKGGVRLPKFNFKKALPLLKASLPFAAVVLLMTIYTRVDAVMIERLLPEFNKGAYQAGIYAAGYRLLDAANMIPYLIASILIPVFSKNIAQEQDSIPLVKLAAKILFMIAAGFTVLVLFFGKDLLNLMYVQATMEWEMPFIVLLLSFNAVCMTYLFGGYLTASHKLRTIGKLAFIAILLNVILNYLWIPKYGALGAAWATVITQSGMAIMQGLIVKKKLRLTISWTIIGKMISYSIVLTAVAYFLYNNSTLLWLNIAAIALLGITLAFLFRIVSAKNWRLLQEKKTFEDES